MNNKQYYIKYIWGDGGQKGYPENNGNLVAFALGQGKPCNRFKECDGFFLYETGCNRGAKAIYAKGVVDADQTSFLHLSGFGAGEEWPYAVKVVLQTRVNPQDGVSLHKIEEITGKKVRNKRGGLMKITEEEFETLSSELIKRKKH